MGTQMTSASIFSVQPATNPQPSKQPQPKPSQASTSATATKAQPEQTDAGSTPSGTAPARQDFKKVMDEQSQTTNVERETPSEDAVSTEVADAVVTVVEVQPATNPQQQTLAAALSLPLMGQTSAAVGTTELSQQSTLDMDGPLDDTLTLSLSSQIQLAQNGSANQQGGLLPSMTQAYHTESSDTALNEFDHLLQQRLMSPMVQAQTGRSAQSIQQFQAELNSTGMAVEQMTSALNAPIAAQTAGLTHPAQWGMSQDQTLNQTAPATPLASDALSALDVSDLTPSDAMTLDEPLMTSTSQQTASTLMEQITEKLETSVEGLDATQDVNQELKAIVGESKTEAAQAKIQKPDVPVNQAQTAANFKIDVSPKDNRWGEIIAERIAIMNTDNVQHARIQLDPPEMGVLEIRLRVQQDQVAVAFNSGNQMVRDALDSQSARLRDMLEQQGIQLTDVSVGDQGQQSLAQQQGDAQGQDQAGTGDPMGSVDAEDFDGDTHLNPQRVIVSNNLVDERA